MDEEHIRAFKRDYHVLGKYNLDVQVPYLARLAQDYHNKYLKTGDWTDCIKAHGLYNSCGARRPEQSGWEKQAFDVQQSFWRDSSKCSFQFQKSLTQSFREELASIRSNVGSQMDKLKGAVENGDLIGSYNDRLSFNISVAKISVECNEMMVKFAGRIMEESMKILESAPPCSFSVVAIGSLARGEATPFSDFEYLFLIKKLTPSILKYFETLAITSYFLMGNLQETKLSYLGIAELYGWFDDCSISGFKIDGLTSDAGNIPTGNGLSGKESHFILTPDEFLGVYREVMDNPTEESLRGDFSAMSLYMKQVYRIGNEDLLAAVKSVMKDVIPNQSRKEANWNMLRCDIQKFNFSPNVDLENMFFTLNVKKQIYRFPSILLLDLAVLYQIREDNVWIVLTQLCSIGAISSSMKDVFAFLLASACFIRLAAYLYHGGHDDRISVAKKVMMLSDQSNMSVARSSKRWYIPENLYQALFGTIRPVKQHLLSRLYNIEEAFLADFKVEMSSVERIMTFYSCGNLREAFNLLLDVFGRTSIGAQILQSSKQKKLNLDSISCLADILKLSCRYEDALALYQYLIKEGFKFQTVKTSECYLGLLMPEKAIQCANEAFAKDPSAANKLFRCQILLEQQSPELATAVVDILQALQSFYDNRVLDNMYDYYGNPIKCFGVESVYDLTSLDHIERLSYISNVTNSMIACLVSLGDIYRRRGELIAAESYYAKSLQSIDVLYGANTLTLAAAKVMRKRSIVYLTQGRLGVAEELGLKSLKMMREIYGNTTVHEDIATVLQTLGEINKLSDKHQAALVYFNQAYDHCREVFGPLNGSIKTILMVKEIKQGYADYKVDSRSNASPANVFDSVYDRYRVRRRMGYTEEATMTLVDALEYHKHIDSLGYDTAGYYDKLFPSFNTKDYEMIILESLKEDRQYHHDTAKALYEISKYQKRLSNYGQALNSCKTAMKIFGMVYGESHLNVGRCWHLLGGILRGQNEPRKAMQAYKSALKIHNMQTKPNRYWIKIISQKLSKLETIQLACPERCQWPPF